MSTSPPIIMNEAAASARVKFKANRLTSDANIKDAEYKPLAKALVRLEDLGAAPITTDGKVCGNGAVLCGDSIIVSKSGRYAGTKFDTAEFVRVISFDEESWTASFSCSDSDPTSEPSSDAPLLWYTLMVAPKKFEWTKQPRFILHGHTFKTAEEAKCLNVPCSTNETMFSTPSDLDALVHLLAEYPYPKHKMLIRLNHGFFILADTADEAIQLFETKLELLSNSKPSISDDDDDEQSKQEVSNKRKAVGDIDSPRIMPRRLSKLPHKK